MESSSIVTVLIIFVHKNPRRLEPALCVSTAHLIDTVPSKDNSNVGHPDETVRDEDKEEERPSSSRNSATYRMPRLSREWIICPYEDCDYVSTLLNRTKYNCKNVYRFYYLTEIASSRFLQDTHGPISYGRRRGYQQLLAGNYECNKREEPLIYNVHFNTFRLQNGGEV